MKQLPVWIDKNNFDKVLVNLLSNSFKYTPDSGEIIVILTSGIEEKISGNMYRFVEIRVLDSGIGLEKDKQNKIFDRFYQIGNELTFSSIGTGIGLNLCRILVELHHGTITAANRVEAQGSCFTIRIPLGKDHLRKEELADGQTNLRPTLQALTYTQPSPTKKNSSKSKTNYKILIVDDEVEIRDFLRQELEEDYKITTCVNGIEALGIIHSNTPDLIISDVVMPEMNGFELLKKIKENSNLSHIPVILLTSKIEHEDRMEGLEKGADAYLCKPFNTDELDILVKNLITSRRFLKGKYSGAQDQEDKIKTIEFKSSDEMLMERIMTFVNENIDNAEMNVEMLAQSVGLGRVQLHRKLKEMTGIPTGEFVRNLRLKQAAILLKEKKINVTQIAYAVGFTNQTHFSTAFKKFYGVSPREYIQQFDES
jgi:DNA-binding response OmpR family regulator